MSALLDLWHGVGAVFSAADGVTVGLMAVIAVGAGVMMRNLASIVTATLGALFIFGLATFARAALQGAKDAQSVAQSDWHSLQELQVHTLLVYAIPFAAVILAAYLVRSAVQR